MADITRTAKGTAKSKTSGTTLTLSSVSLTENHGLIAIVGFQGINAPSSVKAGAKDLHKVVQRIDSTNNFGIAIYHKRVINNGDTRDIVATWASAIGARQMIVLTTDQPILVFESAGNIQNTASPTTSAALNDLPIHNCFHLGAFASEGPSSDAAPTLSTDWTAGQRDGTVGAPPISNITVMEGYKVGRCIDAEEMDSSGSVTRGWCNALATFKPSSILPALDASGSELEIGDTVLFEGSESTISSLIEERGIPVIILVLADGRRAFSNFVEFVS